MQLDLALCYGSRLGSGVGGGATVKRRLGTVAVGAALVLAACGDEPLEDAPHPWRIALEEIEGSIQHVYARRFAEEIEARSEGRIQVDIYPYGALGQIEDIYEQLQDGAIHLAFGSGLLGNTVPESQLFSLHFVLSDDEQVNARALNNPEFLWSEPLQEAYRERDLQLLALVPEGWQVWSANRPILTPGDFRGTQIRVMDNRLLRETYRSYDADPTPMEYGELYSGLQLGLVDAAEQPYFAHYEMRFYEVQDYLISARHAQFIASFMASRVFYDHLPEEKRVMLREIAEDLVEWAHRSQQEINRERLEAMLQTGIVQLELTEEERWEFRERSLPVRAVFASEVGERGERLLEQLLDSVSRAEAATQAPPRRR